MNQRPPCEFTPSLRAHIIPRPLEFLLQHAIHGGHDLRGHVDQSLAQDEPGVLGGLGRRLLDGRCKQGSEFGVKWRGGELGEEVFQEGSDGGVGLRRGNRWRA